MRARLDTGLKFLGIFRFFVSGRGSQGTPGTIFGGEGALSLPPQVPFSHALVSFFPLPVFYVYTYIHIYIYISAGPRGPEYRDAEFRALL